MVKMTLTKAEIKEEMEFNERQLKLEKILEGKKEGRIKIGVVCFEGDFYMSFLKICSNGSLKVESYCYSTEKDELSEI